MSSRAPSHTDGKQLHHSWKWHSMCLPLQEAGTVNQCKRDISLFRELWICAKRRVSCVYHCKQGLWWRQPWKLINATNLQSCNYVRPSIIRSLVIYQCLSSITLMDACYYCGIFTIQLLITLIIGLLTTHSRNKSDKVKIPKIYLNISHTSAITEKWLNEPWLQTI